MAFAANGAEVDENIVTRITGNKAESFRSIEPLDCASITVAHVVAGCRTAVSPGWVEADRKVQEHRSYRAEKAERSGRLASHFQLGKQGQRLQYHSQDQQGADNVLQLLARTFVPVRDDGGEDQVEQAKQRQVESIGLLQVRCGIDGAQARDKGQQ
ncbi:hypothetical protein D3C76_1377550 [compost metagenome]